MTLGQFGGNTLKVEKIDCSILWARGNIILNSTSEKVPSSHTNSVDYSTCVPQKVIPTKLSS